MADKPLLDVLRPGLRAVFASHSSPESRAQERYYADKMDGFWSTLHQVGLTPELLGPVDPDDPQSYHRLLKLGLGLTDLRRGGEALLHRLKVYYPCLVVLVGAQAAGVFGFTGLGAQGRLLEWPGPVEPEAFVVPDPSADERDLNPWRELADRVRSATPSVVEEVLSYGCEGGAETWSRLRFPDGYRYSLQHDEGTLYYDFMDEEERRGWPPPVVQSAWFSWEEFFEILRDSRNRWHRMHPIFVHPDIADQVLGLVREADERDEREQGWDPRDNRYEIWAWKAEASRVSPRRR